LADNINFVKKEKTMTTPIKIHQEVQQVFSSLARSGTSCCSSSSTLYPQEVLQNLPADITSFTLGNGDPVTPANLEPGETVLDLGSGGGLDCFLAARQVGEAGQVIGIDMTPEMLERARQAAQRLGIQNVAFRQGYLEALPVEDNSVDVVISNCVINLSPDKPQVLHEIFRVLKPGGRISISDTVTNRPVSEQQREDMTDWCGCISGALPIEEYTTELRRAGFVEILFQPNLALASQCCENGVNQSSDLISLDQVKTNLADWQTCEQSIFLPHIILARKPGHRSSS
jgi:arsenite methyltransferase